jgi:hypothetical protein
VQVDGFVSTVEDARSSHPVWFGLESDALASSDDVGAAEAALGVEFPSAYREFVMRFGGRYFAFATIASVDLESDWSILTLNERADLLKEGFLAVAENGVGERIGISSCVLRTTDTSHSDK